MKIDRVTITGADDAVDPYALYGIYKAYPFVEWGILFSRNKQGSSRYPTADYIMKLASVYPFAIMPKSAHFCGWYSRQVLEQGDVELLETWFQWFGRIQLNYNFARNQSAWRIAPVINFCIANPDKEVIIQWNAANSSQFGLTLEEIWPKNIHFLYDSSGGRGVEIANIQSPFKNRYTGYSGGIAPSNIRKISSKIENHPAKDAVWIDLESGVRTNDKFDLGKVHEVLDACDEYVNKK